MSYVIGMDCGGTKTKLVAYRAGVPFYSLTGGPGNIILQPAATQEEIKGLLKQALEEITGELSGVVIGIAGLATYGRQEAVKDYLLQELSLPPTKMKLMSDAQLALLANFKGADGISVIAGTGSVVYGYLAGKFYRVGGWGHLFGDQGSAYWIAKQLYLELTAQLDQNLPLKAYQQLFLDYLEVATAPQAIAKSYSFSKDQFAQATLFLATLTEQYPEIQQIFYQAGQSLAQQTRQLLKNADYRHEQLAISLSGSVLTKNPVVAAAYLADLQQDFVVEQKPTGTDPTRAALVLFKN